MFCPGLGSIFGSGLIFGTGVIYGMIALGKKYVNIRVFIKIIRWD